VVTYLPNNVQTIEGVKMWKSATKSRWI